MSLLIQVTLNKSSRLKDGSVSIQFVTDLEQSSEQFMKIDELRNQHGVLYFKDSGLLTDEEVKAIDAVDIETEGKTKSQRLRHVLYRLWEQTETDQNANEFYASEMEKIISHHKNKLE